MEEGINVERIVGSRIKYYLSFFILALFFNVFSQSNVNGIVVDDKKNKPLSGVEIIVQPGNQIISTNNKGEFLVEGLKEGNYLFSFYLEEFESKNKKITISGRDTTVSLKLKSSVIEIKEVIVDKIKSDEEVNHAFLHDVEGTAIYAGKKTEVVQMDAVIANKSTNNARQIYNHIAGLNIWESDGYGLQLGIGGRGLDPNRTTNFNTRQNGYDMSADNMGYPDAYYSPPAEMLDKIEIVRGASSLQYGTQFGGMINFVLNKGNEKKKAEVILRNTVGSYGFLNTTASVGGKVNKTRYYTFAQFKRADGWRENSDFNQYAGHTNVQHSVNRKLTLSFDYTYMHYLAHQAGGLTDDEFDDNPIQSNRNRNWFKIDWHMPAFFVDYEFTNKTFLNNRTFGLIAERHALGNLGVISRLDDESSNRDYMLGKYRNIGNETRLIHKYNFYKEQGATLLVGARVFRGNTFSTQGEANNSSSADFLFEDGRPLKSDYENPSFNVALFTENIFRVTDKLSITPGVRFEYIDTKSEGFYYQPVFDLAGTEIGDNGGEEVIQNKRNILLTGVGVSYSFKEHLELYGNVSQNYKAIGFSDLRIQNTNQQVDENLQDEQGISGDIGIRNVTHKIKYDVSVFYIRYFDRIGDLPQRENGYTYKLRTNVSDANIFGLEMLVECHLAQIIKDSSDYVFAPFVNLSVIEATYVGSENSSVSGNDVEFVPALNLKTGVKLGYKNLKGSFQLAYISEQYSDATNAISFAPTYTSGIIPSYLVTDLSLAYQYKRYTFESGVNNLLNRMYFTRRATGYPGPGIIPSDGRSFYFTLQVKL